MSKVVINDTSLSSIGDAIREKKGVSDVYLPSEMPAAIRSIEGGGSSKPIKDCYYLFDLGDRGGHYLSNTQNYLHMLEVIDGIDWSSVTCLANMFRWNKDLTSNTLNNQVLPTFNTEHVNTIDYMFYRCESLDSLDFSYIDCTNILTARNAFRYCIGIKSLNGLSGRNFNSLCNMSYMFGNMYSNTSTSTSDLLQLNFTRTQMPHLSNLTGAFNSSNGITRIDFSYATIGTTPLDEYNNAADITLENTFQGCKSLTQISGLDSAMNWSKVTNMAYCFDQCIQLSSISLGDSNTTWKSSISTVGLFNGCEALTSITINGTNVLPLTSSSSLSGVPTSCRIRVPSNLLSAYKAASNWSARKNYIVAM